MTNECTLLLDVFPDLLNDEQCGVADEVGLNEREGTKLSQYERAE